MTLGDEPSDLTVTLPLDSWRRFPDGVRLGAELRRLADAQAKDRGRAINGDGMVTTDKKEGVYRAVFPLAQTT